MTRPQNTERLRIHVDGPERWLWYVGGIRLVLLAIVAAGAYVLLEEQGRPFFSWLGAFYVFGLVSCLWYLLSIGSRYARRPLLLWAQVLVDFCVVAATVSFTQGVDSLFTFLFVVVILEAGLLLGLAQGFVYASLAAAFMLVQLAMPPAELLSGHPWQIGRDYAALTMAYGFLVQVLAFYLTASISGYWNQRIHRMQQFQREILDNMNNGFLITDAEGRVTAINRAGEKVLEVTEQEAAGLPVSAVLVDADGGECPVVTALRTRSDFMRYEFNARVGAGVRVLGLSTSCMYRHDRQVTGMIASFIDITELSRMRNEIQRQDRLVAVGELAASVAHEIRNPIAAIRGALEEMQEHLDTPHLSRRLAAIAIRESDQLNHIVSEFLDYARAPKVEREPFDLGELVEETSDSLRQMYADREGIAIETEIGAGDHRVSGDPSQLRQVFLNVGKNAVEAMGSSGDLTISVERDPVSVVVRFDDDGPGIPPDQMAHIFEPFYTTKESGIGMGLAVCMRIVTAHDGTIRPASRPEGGTSMTVRLPAAHVQEHATSDERSAYSSQS